MRSRINLPHFSTEYAAAIVDDFDHHYGIASRLSKVNARQFELFCDLIGSELKVASPGVQAMFRDGLIDGVFTVKAG